MRTHDVNELGTEKPLTLIAHLALPTICANLASSLYTFIDRLFIGHYVGGSALTAVGIVSPLNNIVAAVTVMLSVGGGAMLATSFGKGSRKQANVIFTNIVVMSAGISMVVVLAFELFASPLCVLCGATAGTETEALAVLFLRVTSLGTLSQIVNIGFATMIRSEGNPSYSMFVTMIGAVINVGANALAIIVLGMGLIGSAWSTVLSSAIAAYLSIRYYTTGRGAVSWEGWSAVSGKIILRTAALGIAPAVFQILSFVNNTLINRSLMAYAPQQLGEGGGDVAIAANTVISTVESIVIMIIMGTSNAVSTVISYSNGAKDWRRLRSAALIGQVMAGVVSVALWLVWRLVPRIPFELFVGEDEQTISVGVQAVSYGKLFIFGLGFQTLASMYFSAISRPQVATLISVSRNGLFLIPALLTLPPQFGLLGVYASSSVSDACSLVLVGGIYLREMARLSKLVKEQDLREGASGEHGQLAEKAGSTLGGKDD